MNIQFDEGDLYDGKVVGLYRPLAVNACMQLLAIISWARQAPGTGGSP